MRQIIQYLIKSSCFLLASIIFGYGFQYFFSHGLESTNVYYINERRLQSTNNLGDFIVTWSIDLGGKDSILDSDFLKAGLERSVKEFINLDIMCNNDLRDDFGDLEGTTFYSVEINIENDPNKLRRISGNGKCRGNRTRCKRGVKKSVSDAGKELHNRNFSRFTNLMPIKFDACEKFIGTNIFELFNATLIDAVTFKYNVDLELVDKLSSTLELDYKVTFVEGSGVGLNQIQEIDFVAQEPVEIITLCPEGQCKTQRETVRGIFSHFGIETIFDDDKHECELHLINCNKEDLVTHIWLGKLTRNIAESSLQ